MEEKKKLFVILTAILSLVSIVLISAAFSTDNWISGSGHKDDNRTSASITFGLFKGSTKISYGVSVRDKIVTVICGTSYCLLYYSEKSDDATSERLQEAVNQYNNHSKYQDSVQATDFTLFPVLHWALTLTFMSLGILFSLVYIGFASFNVCGKPIETITGPLGLYLWNALAIIFSLIAVIVYAVLCANYYSKNIMSRDDFSQGFKSEARLDYSYYMLIVATGCHVINLLMLLVSGVKFRCPCAEEDDFTKTDVVLSGMY